MAEYLRVFTTIYLIFASLPCYGRVLTLGISFLFMAYKDPDSSQSLGNL